MRVARAFVILVAAGCVGLLFAVGLSGDQVISFVAWVSATAVALIVILLREFFVAAAVVPAGMLTLWSRPQRDRSIPGPRSLQHFASLVGNAQNDPRIFTKLLRPRLVKLADHYLPIRYGIDVEREPDRIAEVLGDVAWLVDPTVIERTPTVAELERFLDVTASAESPERVVAP